MEGSSRHDAHRAFAERLREAYPSAVARARRVMPSRLRPVVDPEDLVQSACVLACEREDRLRHWDRDALERWLRWTVVNLILNAHRREARRAPSFPSACAEGTGKDFLESIASRRPTPADRDAARYLRHRVFDAMRGLERTERALVLLVCLRGISAGDAARRLGIEETSVVYRRLRRALDRLARRLDAAEKGDSWAFRRA